MRTAEAIQHVGGLVVRKVLRSLLRSFRRMISAAAFSCEGIGAVNPAHGDIMEDIMGEKSEVYLISDGFLLFRAVSLSAPLLKLFRRWFLLCLI